MLEKLSVNPASSHSNTAHLPNYGLVYWGLNEGQLFDVCGYVHTRVCVQTSNTFTVVCNNYEVSGLLAIEI